MDKFSEEFKSWMDRHGFTPTNLSPLIRRGVGTLKNWRSDGVPPRVHDFVRDFMERYEHEKTISLNKLILEVTDEQFQRWNSSALRSGQLIKDWAIEGLDHLASQESKISHYQQPAEHGHMVADSSSEESTPDSSPNKDVKYRLKKFPEEGSP